MTDKPVPAPKTRRILWTCTSVVVVFLSFTAGYMVALWPAPAAAKSLGSRKPPANGVAPLTDSKRPGEISIHLADAFHRRLDALCSRHGVYAHYRGALGKHRERGLEPLYVPGEWAIMTVPPQKPGEEAQLHKLDDVLLFRVRVGERPATATRILINLPEGQIEAHVCDIKGKRSLDQEVKDLGTTVQQFLKTLEEKDSK
jgi:hypothetical protein